MSTTIQLTPKVATVPTESLHQRLQIAGLDRDQRIAIEKQILDFKIRALEQEEQFEQQRAEIRRKWARKALEDDERELQTIRDKHDARLELLQQQLHQELITETEFNEFRAIVLADQEKELEDRKRMQREAEAARELARQNEQLANERELLMEQFANGLMDREAYNNALLELDRQFALKSLEIADLTDQQRMAARKRLLDMMIAENERETQLQIQEQARRTQLYSDFSEQIGTILGATVAGNESLVRSSLKAVLNMALDALQAQVTMAVASATAQSFAQPDSVATFGASGAARAAVLTALITAAFAGVRAVVNSALSGSGRSGQTAAGGEAITGSFVVNQRAKGKYNVIGADDGRLYSGVPYLGDAKTGVVATPALVGEYGPEMIINAPDFQRLQRHVNYPLVVRAIQESRVPQRASGKYDALPTSPTGGNNEDLTTAIARLNTLLDKLEKDGVKSKSTVVLSDIEAAQELRDVSRKIGSKV